MSLWLETGPCARRQAAEPAGRRRQRARLYFAVALIAGLSLAVSSSVANAFTLPVTGPPNAPRMVFDNQMKVVQVCLPVTNPAAGQSLLYGQRFTDGPVGPSTPAIVLVHGIASSTQAWDVSPTWSVARALASAGYVVFSYDRLGYGQSSYYDHPGGGFTLTTAAHRSMLHDVVNDVKTSGYRITANGDCSAASRGSVRRADRVHSAVPRLALRQHPRSPRDVCAERRLHRHDRPVDSGAPHVG
jgi:hypothetical protein